MVEREILKSEAMVEFYTEKYNKAIDYEISISRSGDFMEKNKAIKERVRLSSRLRDEQTRLKSLQDEQNTLNSQDDVLIYLGILEKEEHSNNNDALIDAMAATW